MFVIYFFAIALVVAILSSLFSKEEKSSFLFLKNLLKYILFFNVGFGGLLAFFGHTYVAEETARMIGWPPGSPFQTEVAFANLSYGVLGLLSIRFHGQFWTATVIGYSTFLFACLAFHLLEFFRGNDAPYNIGVFVWAGDFALPLLLLILLGVYQRNR